MIFKCLKRRAKRGSRDPAWAWLLSPLTICCPSNYINDVRRWSLHAPGSSEQGCQMEKSRTKNPDLGKFWRALQWYMLVYFMAICYTYFVYFIGHLVYLKDFMIIWYILWIL
jgi:hypothetical protein